MPESDILRRTVDVCLFRVESQPSWFPHREQSERSCSWIHPQSRRCSPHRRTVPTVRAGPYSDFPTNQRLNMPFEQFTQPSVASPCPRHRSGQGIYPLNRPWGVHTKTMSHKTEFADVRFKACDNHDSTKSICTLENGPDTNTVLHGKLDFSLRLKPGTTFEQAEEITEYLNKHIVKLSVTFPV
jgi:hypothetical protein